MQQPDPRGIHLYYIHSNYREWILRGRLFTFLLMTVRNYSNCFWAHLSILWPVSVTYNPPYHTHTHAHNKKVITCAGLIFILMRGRAPECSSFIKYRKLDLMYARYSPKRRHFNEYAALLLFVVSVFALLYSFQSLLEDSISTFPVIAQFSVACTEVKTDVFTVAGKQRLWGHIIKWSFILPHSMRTSVAK